jgi:hypothetical protein
VDIAPEWDEDTSEAYNVFFHNYNRNPHVLLEDEELASLARDMYCINL